MEKTLVNLALLLLCSSAFVKPLSMALRTRADPTIWDAFTFASRPND